MYNRKCKICWKEFETHLIAKTICSEECKEKAILLSYRKRKWKKKDEKK